ncbi:MAG: hypothetical protein V3S14_06025 [Anaerolineae bacterium]
MSLYPLVAYRQLFPDGGTDILSPLDPAEDGDHYQPEPHFFEWWYFDAAFEDGSYLVAIFHSSLYNAVDHKPTLDIRYYPPDGDPVVAIDRLNRAAYRAAPDRCRVQIGDCLAVDEGDRYRLSLCLGPLAAELTFWPRLPGWKLGTGHLFADPVSGHHFDWIVPVPRARVEGTLAVAGQHRVVTGAGYHDHNWGNFYLPAAFSGWTWGRVLAGDWTLIFFDPVRRGEASSHITLFMLARGDEVLLATNRVHVHGEELEQEPRTGASYYRRLHLQTLEEPAARLTLTARRAIDALDFSAPHLPLVRHHCLRRVAEDAYYIAQRLPLAGRLAAWLLGKGSYLRWEADYRLDLPDYDVVETGQALYEIMVLARR